jgi:hypothetical protein
MINQNGIYAMAGILTVVIKKAKIIVCILACGKNIKYAPKTPDIAPDAPIAGIPPSPVEIA